MNKEIIKSLEQKPTEDLFYLFKHDGAINFEKKIIAGKILNDQGYDKTLLSKEKKIIIETITSRLETNENKDFLYKKNKKKVNNKIFFGLGYLSFFIIMGMKDYLLYKKDIDWVYLSIMIILGFIFVIYQMLTYKKTLNNLINADVENNELLRFRLKLIEKEWNF